MTELATTPPHADTALAVYLEPHARDARVLLFESEGGAVGERLGRVAAELEIVSPKALSPSGRDAHIGFPDRSFDLVVVVEGAPLYEGAGRALLAEFARVLVRNGMVVVGLADPAQREAPRRARRGGGSAGGSVLAQELSAVFQEVRSLAQTQLAGYALLDLTRAEQAELSVDSRLVRGTRPEVLRGVVLASDGALPDDGRLWVEVPAVASAAPAIDPKVYESLRRAEDDAREALRRESELLRELELLRRAEEHAQHQEKRADSFEQKLLAAEADYDDAVGKVRYFEGQVTERERAYHKERELRELRERELTRVEGALAKSDATLSKADAKLNRATEEASTARGAAEAAQKELATLEARLNEASAALRDAQAEQKRAEIIARDVVEELRRFEQGALERAEHDARVQELVAERDRAVQRALEAEVARESAQLRTDELRAELLALENAPRTPLVDTRALEALESELAHAERVRSGAERALSDAQLSLRDVQSELAAAGDRVAQLDRLLGERDRSIADLQLELARAEVLARHVETLEAQIRASSAAYEPVVPREPAITRDAPVERESSHREIALAGERTGLTLRLRETEEARRIASQRGLEAVGRAERAERELADALRQAQAREANLERRLDELRDELAQPLPAPEPAAPSDELRDALARAEQRIDDLSRELDEADRITAVHAEDADRIETLEGELESARRHMDELDDDVRGRDEEMRLVRTETALQLEASEARTEEARRRENEARAERDAGHAALAEARAMLSQLAQRLGVAEAEPSALLDALAQHTAQPSLIDALRAALSEAQEERVRAVERAQQLERDLEGARSEMANRRDDGERKFSDPANEN